MTETAESRKTMQDYIYQTPQVLRQNIEQSEKLVAPLKSLLEEKKPEEIWLVASGSSHNACEMALPFLKKYWNVKVMTPFQFENYEDFRKGVLPLIVSQSGLSTNAISAVRAAARKGFPAVSITANPNSDISKVSEWTIDYGNGEELVGYVTKGVMTLCTFLILAAMQTAEEKKQLLDAVTAYEKSIQEAPAFIESHYQTFSSMPWVYLCYSYPTKGAVMEGTLKIGETIHIPAACYEVEEYIHGPNLQLRPNYPVFFADASDVSSNRMQQIWKATAEICPGSFLITSSRTETETADSKTSNIFYVNQTAPCFSSYPAAGFFQVLSARISNDLHSTLQHPLMKKFKKKAAAKTENFVNYDQDEA